MNVTQTSRRVSSHPHIDPYHSWKSTSLLHRQVVGTVASSSSRLFHPLGWNTIPSHLRRPSKFPISLCHRNTFRNMSLTASTRIFGCNSMEVPPSLNQLHTCQSIQPPPSRTGRRYQTGILLKSSMASPRPCRNLWTGAVARTRTSGSPERAGDKRSIDIDAISSQKLLPGTPSRARPDDSSPLLQQPPLWYLFRSLALPSPPSLRSTRDSHTLLFILRMAAAPAPLAQPHPRAGTGRVSRSTRLAFLIYSGESGPEQTNGHITRTPSQSQKPDPDAVPASLKDIVRRPSSVQVGTSTMSADTIVDTSLMSPTSTVNSNKSTRRNTLPVMVMPIRSSVKPRSKKTAETAVKEKADDKGPLSSNAPDLPPKGKMLPPSTPQPLRSGQDQASGYNSNTWKRHRAPVPASTSKASKYVQWFHSKSKGHGPADISDVEIAKPVNNAPPTATIPAPRQAPTAPPIHTHLLPTTSVDSPVPLTATPSDQSFAHHGITERCSSASAAATSTCVCITMRSTRRRLRRVRRRK